KKMPFLFCFVVSETAILNCHPHTPFPHDQTPVAEVSRTHNHMNAGVSAVDEAQQWMEHRARAVGPAQLRSVRDQELVFWARVCVGAPWVCWRGASVAGTSCLCEKPLPAARGLKSGPERQ